MIEAFCPQLIELANGCLCCTVADEFVPALHTILAQQPDHIVIETSGLALPKPLVKAFNWPEIASRGFVYVKESEPLLEELKKAVAAALAERAPDVPFDRELLSATVRLAVEVSNSMALRRISSSAPPEACRSRSRRWASTAASRESRS